MKFVFCGHTHQKKMAIVNGITAVNIGSDYLRKRDERMKKELVRYAQFVEMAQPQTIKITDKITRSMDTYRKVRDEVLLHQNVDPDDQPISFLEYSKNALINGAVQEKRDIVIAFNKQLYIRDRTIVSSKSY